jgi:prepilin signal peptidase PulO-like enzyme (type II secretory pathway)
VNLVIDAYWAITGGMLGACIGSYLGVVSERSKRGVPPTGRSRCTCGRQLRAGENVPIWGWLHARGVAACCGARIPLWYLRLEAAAALAGGAVGWLAGGWVIAVATGVSVAYTALAYTVSGRLAGSGEGPETDNANTSANTGSGGAMSKGEHHEQAR